MIGLYLATHYLVAGPGGLAVLRVGWPCPPGLGGPPCVPAMLVTACNPGSRPLQPAANAARQRRLRAMLERRRIGVTPALGQAARGHWAEDSVATAPVGLAAGRAIARAQGQAAWLVLRGGRTVELHFARVLRPVRTRAMIRAAPSWTHPTWNSARSKPLA
ncbi:DUF3293 domain-containing protein [Zavarzinia sp. CC-PAN008]|uniref:DUF3293 domain-containing protein n=1 Tax=Zavarzinia sp. CC-PAN008 TaxID=3243332 RepID=UPI003F743CA1